MSIDSPSDDKAVEVQILSSNVPVGAVSYQLAPALTDLYIRPLYTVASIVFPSDETEVVCHVLLLFPAGCVSPQVFPPLVEM